MGGGVAETSKSVIKSAHECRQQTNQENPKFFFENIGEREKKLAIYQSE